MKTAIHIDHFSSTEGEQVLGNGNDSLADVFRLAPAPDWRDALFQDEMVVLILDDRGQVCGDNSRANLVYVDAKFRQPVSPQRSHHTQSRFAQAVLCPGGAAGVGADRADVDDLGVLSLPRLHLADHFPGNKRVKFHLLSVAKVFAIHGKGRMREWFNAYRGRVTYMKAISALAQRIAEALWWVMVKDAPYQYWNGERAQEGGEVTRLGNLLVDPETGEVLDTLSPDSE